MGTAAPFARTSRMTISTAGEEILIAGIRAGDRAAFETVFRTHHPALLRFAYTQIRDRTEAEDIVHDVFLRVWRTRGDFTVRGSLRTYLLTAVRYGAIDAARRRATEDRAIAADTAAVSMQSRDSEAGTAYDPAHAAELDEAIRRGVAALPERCRMAFLLCREQDLTYAEAAEVMGVTAATVKTQIARALSSLRVALEPFLLIMVAAAGTMR